MGITVDATKVMAALTKRSLKGKKVLTLKCGYSTYYALYVHEDLEANHPNGGNAKYLEGPFRRKKADMVAAVARSINAKNGLAEGLDRAGTILHDESEPEVPVDTGALVTSWFQKVE